MWRVCFYPKCCHHKYKKDQQSYVNKLYNIENPVPVEMLYGNIDDELSSFSKGLDKFQIIFRLGLA